MGTWSHCIFSSRDELVRLYTSKQSVSPKCTEPYKSLWSVFMWTCHPISLALPPLSSRVWSYETGASHRQTIPRPGERVRSCQRGQQPLKRMEYLGKWTRRCRARALQIRHVSFHTTPEHDRIQCSSTPKMGAIGGGSVGATRGRAMVRGESPRFTKSIQNGT